MRISVISRHAGSAQRTPHAGQAGEWAECRCAFRPPGLALLVSASAPSSFPEALRPRRNNPCPPAKIRGIVYHVAPQLSQAEAPCQGILFPAADSQGQTGIWKRRVAEAGLPDHGWRRARRAAQLPDPRALPHSRGKFICSRDTMRAQSPGARASLPQHCALCFPQPRPRALCASESLAGNWTTSPSQETGDRAGLTPQPLLERLCI